MKTKGVLVVLLFLLFGLAVPGEARIKYAWTFKELTRQADLIVVAIPFEESVSIKLARVLACPVREKHTTFAVCTALKGDPGDTTFRLRHYIPLNIPLNPSLFLCYGMDGVRLVSFDREKKSAYLMFLRKEKDGVYVTLSDHADGVDSVFRQGSGPGRGEGRAEGPRA